MQRVLFSIDTEAPTGKNGVDNLIYGKTSCGYFGIDCLMDLFDRYSIKGLFFVDIAEAWEYGEDTISDILKHIEERGHNVGVHLHPDRMADKDRKFLWQYSLEEQFALINQCTKLYYKHLNHYPLAFRAGRYGANHDTLKVLSKLNYKYDMSEFYGRKSCKIIPNTTTNRVVKINNVLEIPVTSYKSFELFSYTRFDKLDTTLPLDEFKHVYNKIIDTNSVDVASFFLHSFSLLDWRKTPDDPAFSLKLYTHLSKEIEYVISKKETKVIDEEDLSNIKSIAPMENYDILDLSKDIRAPYYTMRRFINVMRDRLILNI